MIIELIIKEHLRRTVSQAELTARPGFLRFYRAAMAAPPPRLAPGTLQAVAESFPNHSMAALKMVWQRFKADAPAAAESAGWPLKSLPWPKIDR